MPDVLLYPVTLDSGYTALVRPMSPFLRAAIMTQATEKYPDPDPEPYRQPLQNAYEDGLLESAEDNPKYLEDLKLARQRRLALIYDLVLHADVVAGVEETPREELIERYKPYLIELHKLGTSVPADQWQAVVLLGLICTQKDAMSVGEAALQSVTREGIRKAGNIFRK